MRVRMRCRALAIGLGPRFFARVEFLYVRGDRMQPACELLAQLRDVVRALRAGANLLHFARDQQVEVRRIVLRGVAFRELSGEMRLDLIEPRGGLLHQVLELEPLALHLRTLLVRELRHAIQQIDEILDGKRILRRLRSSATNSCSSGSRASLSSKGQRCRIGGRPSRVRAPCWCRAPRRPGRAAQAVPPELSVPACLRTAVATRASSWSSRASRPCAARHRRPISRRSTFSSFAGLRLVRGELAQRFAIFDAPGALVLAHVRLPHRAAQQW